MRKFKDLTGMRFGRLTVKEKTDKRNSARNIIWKCKCDCGNETYVSTSSLKSGHTRSCGCIIKEAKPTHKDLSGQKFNNLQVLEYSYTKNNRGYWKCKCSCGNIRIVETNKLKSGRIKSCGCLNKNKKGIENSLFKHGLEKTRIYSTWDNMKARCYNIKNKRFKNYGDRGIKICDEWKNNFMSFYNWAMENGYRDDLTIDRIDVNGNYEPSNCRWVTWKEQANNKTTNHYVEYNGYRYTLSQWSKILPIKISPTILKYRIDKLNWSIEDAFNKPVRRFNNNEKRRN